MAVRITVDIPKPIYDILRERSAITGIPIESLIIRALEDAHNGPTTKGKYVTGPMITDAGHRGPDFPEEDNPDDMAFS